MLQRVKESRKELRPSSCKERVPLVSLIEKSKKLVLTVLESTLSFVSPSKERCQRSLVSNLLHKKASSEGHSNVAAVEQLEIELHLLKKNKSNTDVVKGLAALESSIQELAGIVGDPLDFQTLCFIIPTTIYFTYIKSQKVL